MSNRREEPAMVLTSSPHPHKGGVSEEAEHSFLMRSDGEEGDR